MSLLEEIKQAATSSDVSLSVILRKCKILASSLGNQKLAEWVRGEQDGFEDPDKCPSYRKRRTESRGTLSNGQEMSRNVPIPPATLPEDLREQSVTDYLMRGVSFYEELIKDPDVQKKGIHTHWHPNALLKARMHLEQEGNAQLVEAWRVLSVSSIAELLDTVRNRVLDFVLEIEKEAPGAGDPSFKSEDIDGAKVDSLVQSIFLRI